MEKSSKKLRKPFAAKARLRKESGNAAATVSKFRRCNEAVLSILLRICDYTNDYTRKRLEAVRENRVMTL